MKVITIFTQTLPAKLAGSFLLLLTILLSTSCEDPSSIGLDLDPNSNQIGVYYQEIPLTAQVLIQDSLSTTNTANLVVGYQESDYFGKTEGIGYSRLFFNRDVPFPNENAVLDSVRLVFNVRMVLADELNTPKTLHVHLLEEQIRDVEYYNFSSVRHQENPVLTASFNFAQRQDTIVGVKVSNEFTDMLFDEIKSKRYFTDIFTFRQFLPGIALKSEKSENTAFTIRPGNNTGLIFFYRNQGDSVSKAYPIATGINSNLARHFSEVKSDRSGTPTEVITQKLTAYNTGDNVGMKGLLGMLIKLDTRPLEAFLDTLQNATFNQVILEMGPVKAFPESKRPPQFQIMYFTDQTNRVLRRQDGFPMSVQPDGRIQVDPTTNEPYYPAAQPESWTPALLAMNFENRLYSQFLTSHVNAVYRKNLPRRDYLLYPGTSTTDDGRNTLREYIMNKNEIKLKIFYSKTQSL